MKKLNFIMAVLATSFCFNSYANNINVMVDNPFQASTELSMHIGELKGPRVQKTGEAALYSVEDYVVTYLDSDTVVKNLLALETSTFANSDALIISGSKHNNSKLLESLLGYSVEADYLVVKGLKTPANIKVIQFDNVKNSSSKVVAQSLIKNAIAIKGINKQLK
jgi:hypothetical protein